MPIMMGRGGERVMLKHQQPLQRPGHDNWSSGCPSQTCGYTAGHVVGHSLGGCVALQLALHAPQVVASLSLLEPGLFVG
jgi:predicted alpha/beta hydrolase family esterase